MTTLYSCRHAGDEWRITKFDTDLNVESSYLCTHDACQCPQGERGRTCRHQQMLPKFIQRGAIDNNWLYDFDRDGWVQMNLYGEPEGLDEGEEIEGLDTSTPFVSAANSSEAETSKLTTSEIMGLPQYKGVPIREVEAIVPSPSPQGPFTIRRRGC